MTRPLPKTPVIPVLYMIFTASNFPTTPHHQEHAASIRVIAGFNEVSRLGVAKSSQICHSQESPHASFFCQQEEQ